jgi:hypothetical protein
MRILTEAPVKIKCGRNVRITAERTNFIPFFPESLGWNLFIRIYVIKFLDERPVPRGEDV